jgi:hypothetical protein
MDALWPLVAAIVSATAAFIYTRIQDYIAYQFRRRSLAVAIYVEIKEASNSIKALYVKWNELEEIANSTTRHPLLIVSSDIKVLDRTILEELNYPRSVIASITRFHNSIREIYECLNIMNSEKFEKSDPRERLRIVKVSEALSEETIKRAASALSTMEQLLPKKWLADF